MNGFCVDGKKQMLSQSMRIPNKYLTSDPKPDLRETRTYPWPYMIITNLPRNITDTEIFDLLIEHGWIGCVFKQIYQVSLVSHTDPLVSHTDPLVSHTDHKLFTGEIWVLL